MNLTHFFFSFFFSCAILRFTKLTAQQMLYRLMHIIEKESVPYTDPGMEVSFSPSFFSLLFLPYPCGTTPPTTPSLSLSLSLSFPSFLLFRPFYSQLREICDRLLITFRFSSSLLLFFSFSFSLLVPCSPLFPYFPFLFFLFFSIFIEYFCWFWENYS